MKKHFDDIFAALMLAAAVAVLLAGGWCLSHSIARVGSEPEPLIVAEVRLEVPTLAPTPEPTPEPVETPFYIETIPLSPELQQALFEACAEADVPVALALGLIEVESCFMEDAVSAEGCYGLCQLNPRFFPDKLSPADNIREGIGYLGRLLEQYGDAGAALTSYNAGYDTGLRGYANAVLAEAQWWEEVLR